MNRLTPLFYGFIVGVVLMTLPVPRFFFWNGVLDNIEVIFDYGGFLMFIIFGVPLIVELIRNLFKSN